MSTGIAQLAANISKMKHLHKDTLEDTVIAALGNASQQTPSQGQQMDSPQTGNSGNTIVIAVL